MAKVDVTIEKKARLVEVVKVEEVETFTLTLNRQEAEALWAVTQCVGGSPDGYRGVFSSRPDSLERILHTALKLDRHTENDVPAFEAMKAAGRFQNLIFGGPTIFEDAA